MMELIKKEAAVMTAEYAETKVYHALMKKYTTKSKNTVSHFRDFYSNPLDYLRKLWYYIY